MRKVFLQGGSNSSPPSEVDFQRHNLYHNYSPSVLSGKSGHSWTKRSSNFPTSPFGGATSPFSYNDNMVNMAAAPPTNGHSNFARASCAVCGEPLTTSFQGEKVIEPPDCPHVMHEQCYKEFSKDFQNCAICSKPLHIRRGNFGKNFSRNGSLSHHSTTSVSSSFTGGQMAEAIPIPIPQYNPKQTEPEYEFDHADLEDPIDPCPDPIQIPDPRITLYPEHPALTSKSTAQTFTCLISVEIPVRRPRQVESALYPISETPSNNIKSPFSMRSLRSKSPGGRSGKPGSPPPNPKHLYMPKPSNESSDAVLDDLRHRVNDWHGLDTRSFGPLKMWENLKMGVDNTVRDVEVYLFERLLLTIKEKNSSASKQNPKKRKYALKGFIYLEHVNRVFDISAGGEYVLNVVLDSGLTREFTLSFPDPLRLAVWKTSLDGIPQPGVAMSSGGSASQDDADSILRGYEEERSSRPIAAYRGRNNSDSASSSSQDRRSSFANSNFTTSNYTTPTTQFTSEFNSSVSPRDATGKPVTQRAAIDAVLVVSVAASMHGLKLQILKDALKFMAKNLGDYDRMALIVFGGSSGPEVIAGMTRKNIAVWEKAIDALETGPRGVKTDVIEGVNLALDMLSKRRASNPITSILVISDSPAGGPETAETTTSRANDMDVSINTFGFGVTHRPQTLVELATTTGGMYNYCKEWMGLREVIGGCMGSLQSLSHQNLEVRLRVPATQGRIVKITGAEKSDIRPAGREAVIELKQMYFGQKRDILIQMIIDRDMVATDSSAMSTDPWEVICRGLEQTTVSDDSAGETNGRVEEVLLLEASLQYSSVLDGRSGLRRSNPSILTLPVLPQEQLPVEPRGGRRLPPAQLLTSAHPAIVQRRVELLTADMLSKALTLAGRQENEAAHRLLTETRTILAGMTRGALPTPPAPSKDGGIDRLAFPLPNTNMGNASVMGSLEADLLAAAEWISHGTLFQRDFRKQILQQEQIIRMQRAFSFRTGLESYFATSIDGCRQLIENAREWSMALDFQEEDAEC